MFGPSEADVDCRSAVVQPDTVAQIGAAAIVARGAPRDLPPLVQLVGTVGIVAVVSSVIRTGEADIDRRNTVVEPGNTAHTSVPVKALGEPRDLPRLAQFIGVAVFVAVVVGVFNPV